MGYNFTNRVSQSDVHNVILRSFGAKLTPEEQERLTRYKEEWNAYEGFHWENIPETDKPQVTLNYARAFVNKFVSFEFGKGFKIKMKPEIEEIGGDNDPLDFLNEVWEDNDKLQKCIEIGQAKSVTGDAWVQVSFEPKFDAKGKRRKEFLDPFDEYNKGRIKLTVLPSAIVFPQFNDRYDKDRMDKLIIMYPVTDDSEGFFGKTKHKTVLYRQEWTNDRVKVFIGQEQMTDVPNKYGVIPFRQVKNYPIQGKNFGAGDIDDIIPINTELNLKQSDISEIIDYHSAPVTVVYGARIGQLERGANKVWGGLPKDARIENLKLDGDLTAAQSYVSELKKAMFEVGNIPEGALGGSLAVSNTSGVALQIVLMPLLERIKIKQTLSKEGLEWINKMILKIGTVEGLISIPKEVKPKDFYHNEVTFESALPKDTLLELQEMELEMRMGLEDRESAMKRRGKDNIQEKINKIDEDMKSHPKLYGQEDIEEQLMLMKEQAKLQTQNRPQSSEKKVGENKNGKPKQVNAGFQNGPTPKPKS